MTEPARKRVLTASILHEANSFAITPAPLDHFRRQGILEGAEIPARYGATRTEMAGFLASGAAAAWEMLPIIVVPCAPAGPVSAAAFAWFRDRLAAGTQAAGPVDGVLLALHGAMSVEGEPDGDGALAATVRAIVGPNIPISITLDPHSNISDRLAASVNAISAYRTHPHTDHFEAGQRAAATLARAMAGEIHPVVHHVRGHQLRGFDSARTSPPDGPMRRALTLARSLEQADPGVIEISLHAGFGLADVPHAGPSVAVTGNGADPRYTALAARLVRFAWDERHNDTVKMHRVDDALAAAAAIPPGPGPVVISDFGDAPGGGGHGDATALLRAILANPPPNTVFVSIADAAAVQAATAAGEGAELPLELGGHTAPAHGGGPIAQRFRVLKLHSGAYIHEGPYTPGVHGNFGPSALLECNTVRIVVTTFQRNILDLQQLRIFGIDPQTCGLIAIKCMDAFRAAFAPFSRAMIACETGGVSSRVHTSLTFHHLRRPIWPLDPDAVVAAHAGYTP